jgi:MarR family transcriptional regulator, organic hydroperoxide resistance regulator
MTRRLTTNHAGDLVAAERDIRDRIGDRGLDVAAMSAISNIYRAATVVRNHMEQTVLAEHELSWGGFTVLFVLWIWGPQETRHLAEEAGVSKGTLTGLIATLTKRELVTRAAHADDKRLAIISLTAKGQATIETAFPRFNAEETAAAASLSLKEQNQLASSLRKIIRTFDADAETS